MSKKHYIHLTPCFDVEVPYYLKDVLSGEVSSKKNTLFSDSNSCREEIAYGLLYSFENQQRYVELDSSIYEVCIPSFTAPKSVKQAATKIQMTVEIPETHPDFSSTIIKVEKQLNLLGKSEKEQAKFFQAADLILAPIAFLVGGPQAFLPEGKCKASRLWSDVLNVKYQRLNGFWAGTNALCSLVLGQLRYVLQTYAEGNIDSILDKYDVGRVNKFFQRLSKRENLTARQKLSLIRLLEKQRPLFRVKTVKVDPDHFPVNQYTWTMFMRAMKKPSLFFQPPPRKSKTSIYGRTYNGFYSWLKLQKKPTKAFSKYRPRPYKSVFLDHMG